MYATAWFLKKAPEITLEKNTANSSEFGSEPIALEKPSLPSPEAAVRGNSLVNQTMSEKELRALIYEVREKIAEYNEKLDGLTVQESRLAKSQELIKQDIEELESLRIELAAAVLNLKDEQDKLLKSRINIEANEKENLVAIATSYDKMDSDSAGKILINMTQLQNESANDAIKILYYMGERPKADVLASIANIEPAVAAFFCNKLKQIVTKD